MRKVILLFALLVAIAWNAETAGAGDEQRVTLNDGRVALLHPNGTWEYSKAAGKAAGEPLDLVEVAKRIVPQDFEASRFSTTAVLTLTLRNPSDAAVTAWRGLLAVIGPFGEVLFRSKLSGGAKTIPPGETNNFEFAWEDNQFIDDEPFDELNGNMAKNLSFTLTDIEVVSN